MPNFAGKTEIPTNTPIKIIRGDLEGATGKITHAFGFLGMYDHGAIAGAWLDDPKKYGSSEEINLFLGDFEVIDEITPKMKKIYLDNHGEKCPFCLSEQIEGGAGEHGENTNQKMSCLDCDRSWYDLYTLVDIEI